MEINNINLKKIQITKVENEDDDSKTKYTISYSDGKSQIPLTIKLKDQIFPYGIKQFDSKTSSYSPKVLSTQLNDESLVSFLDRLEDYLLKYFTKNDTEGTLLPIISTYKDKKLLSSQLKATTIFLNEKKELIKKEKVDGLTNEYFTGDIIISFPAIIIISNDKKENKIILSKEVIAVKVGKIGYSLSAKEIERIKNVF